MIATMGLDPLTAGLLTTIVPDILHALLGTGGGGASAPQPSAAQIQAALEAQRAASAARTRTYLIAGGIGLVGVVGLVLLLKRQK
jgi:hypothetical protein